MAQGLSIRGLSIRGLDRHSEVVIRCRDDVNKEDN